MDEITIDGVTFNVGIIKVQRKIRIDSVGLGTTLDGDNHYLDKGSYCDYVVTFNTKRCNVSEYDALVDILSDKSTHECTMPYAQGTISGKYRVGALNDSIVSNFRNFRRWSSLQVTFEALSYYKVAE